jgi:hypothetical protein
MITRSALGIGRMRADGHGVCDERREERSLNRSSSHILITRIDGSWFQESGQKAISRQPEKKGKRSLSLSG